MPGMLMQTDAAHDRVIARLGEPAAYPHAAGALRHVQTHISDVFLAGDYAYKVKKPVDLGFVDFTSLDKRRRACEDEVRLNRRLAPDIYLDVVPICSLGQRFFIPAAGASCEAVVDYAVRMARLDDDNRLDRVADQNRLTHAHLAEVADQIAPFHARARRGADIDAHAAVSAIRALVRQNFVQLDEYVGDAEDRSRRRRLRNWAESFLDTHGAQFAERIAQGRIVEGHGDLHLKNICLHRGRIVIFDCVEFSLALRAVDVTNDIAFLTMDLDSRGMHALSVYFLNEYLQRTGDYGGLALFDFYQSHRACVRAKVAAIQKRNTEQPHERMQAQQEIRSYLALAQRYTARSRGGLLIMCGLSGSGKSTVARDIAERLGGVVVRSDAVRKQLAGFDVRQAAGADYGRGIYTAAMTTRTYDAMRAHARAILQSGRWAILDATFGRRAQRAAAAELARENNGPVAIVYCVQPDGEIARRLTERARSRNDISDAGADVAIHQRREFEPPTVSEGNMLVWTGGEDLAGWIGRQRHPQRG